MKKLIIFDLDGVLVDAKLIHYNALNRALALIDEKYTISLNEHLGMFDGLKTTEKLKLLTKLKGLPEQKHDDVWASKQKFTQIMFKTLPHSEKLVDTIFKLKDRGFCIACCSNSIRQTTHTALKRKGIFNYFDTILTNEDVERSKPYPDIFWKAICKLNVDQEHTLILEDSPVGLLAAKRSGCHTMRIKSPEEFTCDQIVDFFNSSIYTNMTPVWHDKDLNILIPMAGAGSRFEQAGYKQPKPLIDVNGKPMIKIVYDSLSLCGNTTFLAQRKHTADYNLKTVLPLFANNANIVEVDGVTEGAACTTLLAKSIINTSAPLVIANSDQYIVWNSSDFMYKMQESNVDGGILTFEAHDPKWSYAKTDAEGYVIEVAEKKVISQNATVGVYFWKHGNDYVKYAEQMIKNNVRVNNEFYVCPVFNEAIKDGKKFIIHQVKEMHGLGTPEDLRLFLNR